MASSHPRSRDGLFKRDSSPYWQCWIRGQRRSTKCRDREAARTVKAQFERAVADPKYFAAHQATFGGAVSDFLDNYKTRDRSAHTAKMYAVKCGHLVRIIGADTKLADVGARNVDTFVKTRLAEGAARTSVGKDLTALRQVLLLARRHGAYPFQLEEVMPIGFSAEYEPKTRALTWDEFEKLVPEVAKFHPEHAAMVVYFVALGTRKSEAEKARGEDVDWDGWTAHIRGTKTKGADAVIPIAEPFRELFTALVPRKAGPLWGVWTNMTRDLAAACKRIDIVRVTANDLRRSHGTLLRLAGASVDIVARMLRHADSRMAERVYARIGGQDTGRLLAAQLATVPKPPVEHRHLLHSACTTDREISCVRGRNRTADTRIFNPPAVTGEHRPIAESSADLDLPESDASPDSPGLPSAYSTPDLDARRAGLHFRWSSRAWFHRSTDRASAPLVGGAP